MSASDVIMIVVGIIALFAGYGFGWVEWGRKLKNLEEEHRSQEALKGRTENLVPPPPVAALPVQPADPFLLSLREVDGRLSIELEGRILNADTISTDQRKRLIEVVTRLRPWLEGRAASVTPVSIPDPGPLPSPAPTPTRPVPAPKKKEEMIAPLSMVAQIDEILQKNILETPLEKMGIRLVEVPGGGVTVYVGLKRYAGVGEVPDPAVQSAIRAAIAEWERKFTPG
jgi:hypothetical protein